MSPRLAPVARADGWTFECKVQFKTGANGRTRMRDGDVPAPEPFVPGSVPRVARLVALAHRFQGLLASGAAKDYADLARLARVTRQRVTQIMNLLHLAPDIQEAILDLPRTVEGGDPILERHLRPIAATPEWSKQRALWRELTKRATAGRTA